MPNFSLDEFTEYNNLSEEEQKIVLQILQEMSTEGTSPCYDSIALSDYKETPVDIITFIKDRKYLGDAWHTPDGKCKLFPFWEEKFKQLFPDNLTTAVNNTILSGARGLGKSECAVTIGLYLMYRLMCLKDPYVTLGLKPTERVAFAFMNITEELALDIGVNKFQNTVQLSPWFMKRGTLSGKKDIIWNPPEFINIIVGSQPRHVIGQGIYFCLDGDTKILTDKGIHKISSLVDCKIKVVSIDRTGKNILSDECTVKQTALTKEIYKISLSDGSSIECTGNHKLMLTDGIFIEASQLKRGDRLYSVERFNSFICNIDYPQNKTFVNSVEKIILDEPIPLFDVINANPFNNFLIVTPTSYICSHNCFMDEVSFIANQDIEKQKQKAYDILDTAMGGMATRFTRRGKNPTMLVLASSKRSEKSFLETHMKKKLETEKENVFIVDEPVWHVRPASEYCGKTFWVAQGNKFLASEVIPEDPVDIDDKKSFLKPFKDKGYKILDVPVEYRAKFLEDIDRALCDYAGVSSSDLTKYISGTRLQSVKLPTVKNMMTKEILEVGNAPDDKTQYYDFADIQRVDPSLKYRPLFIHLDMSTTGDKTGIAGVWILGKKPPKEGEPSSKELYYQPAFGFAVKAPRGYQISFEKHRQFIYWLREQGFNIKGVSADSFQSADLAQQITAQGFNYTQISVDRIDPSDKICKPYHYLKNTIYEERIRLFDSELLTEELLGLERNSNGVINHPDEGRTGCFTGDTKVRLVDGRSLTFLELVKEHEEGKTNWVYSFNENKKCIEPKKILKAWCTQKNASLIQVVLDNNEVIQCTPNHRFMLRDGSYKYAKDLKEYDSLMPLYTKLSDKGLLGYRLYYEPVENKWHYEHRVFSGDKKEGTVLVHHINCNKSDNTPTNLMWVSKEDHQRIHASMQTGTQSPESKKKRSKSVKQWHVKNKGTALYEKRSQRIRDAYYSKLPEGYIEQKQQEKILKAEKNRVIREKAIQRKIDEQQRIKEIENIFNVKWENLSISEKDSIGVRYSRMKDDSICKNISSSLSIAHQNKDTFKNAYEALKDRVWYTNGVDSIYIKSCEIPPEGYTRGRVMKKRNHKVIAVIPTDNKSDVYDITVEDNHNFALDSGVFVHNSKDLADALCGAVYNASQHAEEFAFDFGENIDTIIDTNSNKQTEVREQITVDFEEELKKTFDKTGMNNNSAIDFGMGKAQVLPSLYTSQGIIVW